MRTLEFKVDGQKLSKNETCNFDDIVSGSSGYLQAKFIFDKSWNGYIKAAVFTERKTESAVRVKDNVCMIPAEVLTRRSFTVRVAGRNKIGTTVQTNSITVEQRG